MNMAKSKPRTRLGLDLETSAKEILAHVKGEKTLPVRRLVLPDQVSARRIRSKMGMSLLRRP